MEIIHALLASQRNAYCNTVDEHASAPISAHRYMVLYLAMHPTISKRSFIHWFPLEFSGFLIDRGSDVDNV